PPSSSDDGGAARDAFMAWFVGGGGTLHPVLVGDGVSANVTADAAPGMGGARRVPSRAVRFAVRRGRGRGGREGPGGRAEEDA
ncbi:hypothetical protein THAOC_11436, partial [Thalassiosira oceanica]